MYFAVFLTTPTLAWYQLIPLALAAVAGSVAIAIAMIALTFGSFLLSSWYAASSADFPLGDPFGVPRLLVYLLPIAIAAIVLVALRDNLPELKRRSGLRRPPLRSRH